MLFPVPSTESGEFVVFLGSSFYRNSRKEKRTFLLCLNIQYFIFISTQLNFLYLFGENVVWSML